MIYLFAFSLAALTSGYLPQLPPLWPLLLGLLCSVLLNLLIYRKQVVLTPPIVSKPIVSKVAVSKVTISTFTVPLANIYRLYSLPLGLGVSAVLLGLSLGVGWGHQLLRHQLPPPLESVALLIDAKIVGLPRLAHQQSRVWLIPERLLEVAGSPEQQIMAEQLLGKKIQVGRFLSPDSGSIRLAPGQRWRVWVKLRRPRGLVNPGGFDYQASLLRKGLYATGYVYGSYAPQLLNESCVSLRVDCLRWQISQKILTTMAAKPPPQEFPSHQPLSASLAAAALVALAVGDTQWLSMDQWEWLKQTGTIHLLAISGLHIGLAAGIGFFLGRLCVRLATVLWPYQHYWLICPALLSIIFAIAYSLLAGMSLPTLRALVMVAAYHLINLCAFRVSPLMLLASALAVVAITDPLELQAQGFWLSFLAVLLLFYGFGGRRAIQRGRAWGLVAPLLKSQYLLGVGLLLPSLLWVQGVSLVAPLANLVAVTGVSLVVVPALLLYLALSLLPGALASWLGIELLMILGWVVDRLFDVLAGLAGLPIPFWRPALVSPSWWALLLAAVGVALCLLPRGLVNLRWVFLASLCLLPLLFPSAPKPVLGLDVMDVGQGTGVVIRVQERTLVYDTGRAFSERFSIGQHVLAPYLYRLGASRVDRLVVSHGDGDHAGGVAGLLNTLTVDDMWLGEPLGDVKVKRGLPPSRPCYQGQFWRWGEVSFHVLWPRFAFNANHEDALASNALEPTHPRHNILTHPQDHVPSHSHSSNNRSCVILIRYGKQRILLAGDIEKSVERELLTHPLLARGVDILLVGHHGSKTSSSYAWLRLLRPQWAVISAGYKNPYGHPHPSIESRFSELGIQSLNTAELGAIRFRWFKGQGTVRLERWRIDYPRYWY